MSLHLTSFFSNTLKQTVNVNVTLPEPMGPDGVEPDFAQGHKPLRVIWLLHGLSDDASAWLRNTTIEPLASQYRYALVMPQTQRGFYTNIDGGPQYWDFLSQELIPRMRFMYPLSDNPEDNIVMGNSMGGYGALKLGLSFPDQFRAIVALSPAIDLTQFPADRENLMPEFNLVFRNKDLTAAPTSIYALLDHQVAPVHQRIFMATGSEDFLRPMDLAARSRFAQRYGKLFTWHDAPGHHNWQLWQNTLTPVFEWLSQEVQG